MVWKVDDIWLWLGLGAFTFVAIKGVAFALQDVSDLTRINEQPEKKPWTISQETEDALNSDSLAVLAESHDRATSNSAILLLADRFCRNQSAITSLTGDLCSNNPALVARAHSLLKMIERCASDTGSIQFLLDLSYDGPEFGHITHDREFVGMLREHDVSAEELELRRRRREAVVFHEGGGPVSQDDIIQRSAEGEPRTSLAVRNTTEDPSYNVEEAVPTGSR